MITYIDESGIFANPDNIISSVSCVAAVTIPEIQHDKIIGDFQSLITKWHLSTSELKGRLLNERQISELVTHLSRYSLMVNICAIDIGLHSDPEITGHKLEQAGRMIKHITPQHQPDILAMAQGLKARIEALPNQLYVQSTAMQVLVDTTLRRATAFYAQTIPSELGNFTWVIHAKSKTITKYEKLWHEVIMPFLQSSFLREPLITVREWDYSAFTKFENPVQDSPPEYIKPHVAYPHIPWDTIALNRIFGTNIAFENSTGNLGIKLADVIANAFQRAFNNKLQRRGWRNLGKLMVKDLDRGNSIKMIALQDPIVHQERLPYAEVYKEIETKARPIIIIRPEDKST